MQQNQLPTKYDNMKIKNQNTNANNIKHMKLVPSHPRLEVKRQE